VRRRTPEPLEVSMPNTKPGATGTNKARDLDPNALRADASAAVTEIQDVAKKVADEAGAQAGQIAQQAKAQVAQATDTARQVATDQKQFIAAQVGGVADVMEKAADELEGNSGVSAQYARFIADNAEKLSTTLRDKSVDELIGIAQDFGRKQPAAFIGAAAILGFAASRFIRASAVRMAQPAPTNFAAGESDAQFADEEPWSSGSSSFGTGPGVTSGRAG